MSPLTPAAIHPPPQPSPGPLAADVPGAAASPSAPCTSTSTAANTATNTATTTAAQPPWLGSSASGADVAREDKVWKCGAGEQVIQTQPAVCLASAQRSATCLHGRASSGRCALRSVHAAPPAAPSPPARSH
eukprot:222385-Chlamydomonas_euryale.AAC.2